MAKKSDLRRKTGSGPRDVDALPDEGRRRACKLLLGGLVAGLCCPGSALDALAGEERRGRAADLAAVKGSHEKATRRAVELIGGMKAFVKPGQVVVVKPNIGFDRVPEQAANTNPDVVAEVVRMVLGAGAKKVLVFDRSSNDPSRCYKSSQIAAKLAAIGDDRVKVFIPSDADYSDVAIPKGVGIKKWPIHNDAAKADVFINCPVAKHHVFSVFSGGMKNIMGVAGGARSMLHEGFEHKIVDLNLARPSDLVVLDATRILISDGPQGGPLRSVRRHDTVIACANVVAADAYATRFFDLVPGDVAYLKNAFDRGLLPSNANEFRVVEEAV